MNGSDQGGVLGEKRLRLLLAESLEVPCKR
jgi:hypothetical protein